MNPPIPDPVDDLVDALSEIEHEQWMHWSQAVAPKVSTDIQNRWQKSWVDYSELSEELKEADRAWARKVMALLRKRRLME